MARSKIEKASTDLNEAIKELDVGRICQHCTNDAKIMPPGSQLLEGMSGNIAQWIFLPKLSQIQWGSSFAYQEILQSSSHTFRFNVLCKKIKKTLAKMKNVWKLLWISMTSIKKISFPHPCYNFEEYKAQDSEIFLEIFQRFSFIQVYENFTPNISRARCSRKRMLYFTLTGKE